MGACLSTSCRELGENDQEKQRGAQQCCRFRSVGILLLSRVELGGRGGSPGFGLLCCLEGPVAVVVDRRLASKLPSGEAKIRGCEDQAGPNQELEARGTEWGEPWGCGASRWGRSLWRRAPHREEAERGVGAARGT